ncbi:hypothetical protein STCU_09299 [Strigomonas culicis]|uniref:Uncharacterized protein n=1 Tax=Strigomonas culicis TaxID=28005 RepID=S9UYT6_9TRYP|nr:hypothetical protein STCU_09299 [Strigomonas culicis]|eukprot:EPY19781.1 hypothetical protein STCU_09299 [Strigomonas culicis]
MSMCASAGGSPERIAAPPSFDSISQFMAYHAARRPSAAEEVGVRAYSYTGCDYALVLHACFPSRCIALGSLCWSPQPLKSQEVGNLARFCDAAKALRLLETPYSALTPERLQPVPACVVHHVAVQHWLYVASQRFLPAKDHHAAVLRTAHRSRQLGEPFRKRARETVAAGGVEALEGGCGALRETKPLAVGELRKCAPYIAPVPALTGEGEEQVEEAPKKVEAPRKEVKPAADSKSKPWLSYSKPWLLPAQDAAKAKREAALASRRKAEDAARAQSPWVHAFVDQSSTLEQQYLLAERAATELRQQLKAIQADMEQELASGADMAFDQYAERLKKLAPSTV